MPVQGRQIFGSLRLHLFPIGAATSLKYADPRELPSFPSRGLSDKDSSAGAAASLANANRKSFEYWKPVASSSAGKAAMLAKDYKPPPLWHPELSAAGSKAALLAAKDGGHVDIWRPEASEYGNSAAEQAMRKKELSPQIDYGYTADGNRRALLAATGAMSGSRRRAGSTPVVNSPYPDSEHAASNALNAAARATKPSGGYSLFPVDERRIHDAAVTTLPREMYTSHPPVAIEVEEQNRQAGLRAAAVSMAKQMYAIQQRTIDQATEARRSDSHSAANTVHARQPSIAASNSAGASVPQYTNLQEAAQKLAAERLAKLRDEHDEYRSYYGMNPPPHTRLSIKGRSRRRASFDSQSVTSDEEQSRKIRSEMSIFSNKLAKVDENKRQQDREALMAAAQRNVAARLHGMDEKVFAETGKVSPAMMEEWETKAKARAQADSKTRMVNHGKVNIGGGKYLDQTEVDAIALARVQPTLDEINAKAEKQRAREEEIRLDNEERKRLAQEEKRRDLELKAEQKRARGMFIMNLFRRLCSRSQSTEEEKRVERIRKHEEKTRKAEGKRTQKEEKRKSKEVPKHSIATDVEVVEKEDTVPNKLEIDKTAKPMTTTTNDSITAPSGTISNAEEIADRVVSAPVIAPSETPPVPEAVSFGTTAGPAELSQSTTTAKETSEPQAAAATSPQPSPTSLKGDSKVKSWLKGKLTRRAHKTQITEGRDSQPSKPFVGGAALTGPNMSSSSLERRDSSVREVALAGTQGSGGDMQKSEQGLYSGSEEGGIAKAVKRDSSPSISSLSSDEDHARGRQDRRRSSSSRGDEFQEARDTFDEKLAPPRTLDSAGRASDSPVRDSKFLEDL